MNVRDQLADFIEDYREAPVEETREFEDLPDGSYQVQVEETRFENAKTSGRLQLAWVFSVLAPANFRNRKIWHYRGLDKQDSVQWMKQELHNAGMDEDDILKMQERIEAEELIGRVLEIGLKTKVKNGTPYQNLYINRVVCAGDFAPAEGDTLPPTDDDISF